MNGTVCRAITEDGMFDEIIIFVERYEDVTVINHVLVRPNVYNKLGPRVLCGTMMEITDGAGGLV